jgi:high-affinity iron transporter
LRTSRRGSAKLLQIIILISGPAVRPLFVLLLTLAALLGASSCALAQDTPASQTAWRLLDYVAVDYGGAVQDGRIVSAAEYAEMIEFTASVRRLIAEARPTNAQPLHCC